MDRVFDSLSCFIERVLALAFVLAVALNFVNVIARYVFDASMLSADEIQIYTIIWITFLGAVVVTWRRQHLRMDVVVRAFPQPVQNLLRAIELALIAALGGFMLVNSFDYVATMHAIGRTSDTAGIPLWTVHASLPLGFGLMAAISVWRLAMWRRHADVPTAPLPRANE